MRCVTPFALRRLHCAEYRKPVIIFGSFLDIRGNAEWPRFLAHPVCYRGVLLQSLDDLSEGGAEPIPGAVDDKVGRVGDERCVMCVELARLV